LSESRPFHAVCSNQVRSPLLPRRLGGRLRNTNSRFPWETGQRNLVKTIQDAANMRLLPREHGATVIWFSSVLLAFGTLREPPWTPGVIVFLAASVLAPVITGRLTSRSTVILRLQRNQIVLPVLSGLLTLIVPLGQIVMVGRLSFPFLAAWLVFLTYSSLGVVYTRDMVRSMLKESPPTWTSFSLSAVFIVAEVIALNAINRLSILALAIVVPLTVHRVIALSLIQRKASSTVERIRSVGFVQTGNLIAATIILALVSKL